MLYGEILLKHSYNLNFDGFHKQKLQCFLEKPFLLDKALEH